jgi:hypothetical protein
MKIWVKQLQPELTSLSGWLVYVLSNTEQSIEAEVCELIDLNEVIVNFKLKYNI